MIEDSQLQQMFRMESEERLAKLDSGVLRLERMPADPDLLEELFREVHSLKGAARMLGLLRVESTAHGLESVLNAARKAEAPLTAEGIESLNRGLKKLRNEVGDVLAPPREKAAPAAPAASPQAEVQPVAPEAVAARPFHIETVRVETEKLDDLLTLTGELGILQGRSLHRQGLMASLSEQWAQLERSRRELRSALPGAGGRLQAVDEALTERFGKLLQAAHNAVFEDAARFEFSLGSLQERVYSMRLLPLSTVFNLFPRMVRDMAKEEGKEVELLVEGGDLTLDKRILEEIKDPLMHLLRNAVGHGIELPEERISLGKPRTGRIRLTATRGGDHVTLSLADDGRGLDMEAIRRTARQRGLHDAASLAAMPDAQVQQLVFAPGFSTASHVTELAGRGVGLDVVSANVERLKGTIQLDSSPGQGTTIDLQLPLSLTTLRLLVVQAAGQVFGLPMESVQTVRRLARGDIYRLEGRAAVDLDGEPLLVRVLADLLELGDSAPGRDPALAYVVIQVEKERLGLQVDAILEEEEVVPRPLGAPLRRVRNVAGLATLASGRVCPVLNPHDLLRSAARGAPRAESPAALPEPALASIRRAILLAEDSALVRAMEKRIIEDAGFEVVAAVDGADALEKLDSRPFAGVVSDIQMPNLDGLALTARIRQDARYRDLPVILVSTLDSEADKRRGLEVGANAYIPKPSFDQRVLVETLRRLLGP